MGAANERIYIKADKRELWFKSEASAEAYVRDLLQKTPRSKIVVRGSPSIQSLIQGNDRD